MAYVELTYYRDCALELREYGDAGWAVHIYAPRHKLGAGKLGVIMTNKARELSRLMADARKAVDTELGSVAKPELRQSKKPVAPYDRNHIPIL